MYIGEFGVVYRGLLLSETKKIPEAVAVKTLKGHAALHVCMYYYIHWPYNYCTYEYICAIM